MKFTGKHISYKIKIDSDKKIQKRSLLDIFLKKNSRKKNGLVILKKKSSKRELPGRAK